MKRWFGKWASSSANNETTPNSNNNLDGTALTEDRGRKSRRKSNANSSSSAIRTQSAPEAGALYHSTRRANAATPVRSYLSRLMAGTPPSSAETTTAAPSASTTTATATATPDSPAQTQTAFDNNLDSQPRRTSQLSFAEMSAQPTASLLDDDDDDDDLLGHSHIASDQIINAEVAANPAQSQSQSDQVPDESNVLAAMDDYKRPANPVQLRNRRASMPASTSSAASVIIDSISSGVGEISKAIRRHSSMIGSTMSISNFSLSDAKPLDGETDEVASIFPDQDFQTPVKIPSPEPPKRFSSEPSKRTSIPLAALPPSPSPIPPTETATPTSTTQEPQNTITPEKLETIQESPVTSPGPIYASVEVIEVVHQAIVAETVVSEPVEYVEPSLPIETEREELLQDDMVADVEDKTESVEETAGTTLSDPSSFNVPSVVELSATDDLIPESVVTAVTAAPVVDVVVDVVVVVEDEIQQQVLEADEDDVLVVESAVSASGFDLEVVKDDVDVAGDEEKKDVVETQVVEVQDPSKSVESSSVEEVVVAVVDVEEVNAEVVAEDAVKEAVQLPEYSEVIAEKDVSVAAVESDVALAAELPTVELQEPTETPDLTSTGSSANANDAVTATDADLSTIDTISIETKSDGVTQTLQALKTRLTYRPQVAMGEKEKLANYVLDLARPIFFPPTTPSSAETLTSSPTSPTNVIRRSIGNYQKSAALARHEFDGVAVCCRIPKHLSYALHKKCCSLTEEGRESGVVTWVEFELFVETVYQRWNPDMEALSFEILKRGNGERYLVPEDFKVFVEDVLENNSAFAFLASSPDFQARFTETVLVRLFYSTHFHGRNRLSLRDFRTAGLYKIISDIESATNSLGLSIPAPFSYKDFYVIYCAFWELDKDHDMYLTLHDLERYADRGLSHAALARVIECYGRVPTMPEGTADEEESTVPGAPPAAPSTVSMLAKNKIKCFGFKEFVSFIMAVEDKTSISGLYYWFRVLDIDEDGLVSLLEIETFWEHQYTKVPEQYTVYDFFSLIIDLLQPSSNAITLIDLKRNPRAAGLFLDFLFDSRRHMENVRRSADVGFRMNDEVWITEEEEDTAAAAAAAAAADETNKDVVKVTTDDSQSIVTVSSTVSKRVRLEGWQKFAERRYRLLSGSGTDDEGDDDI